MCSAAAVEHPCAAVEHPCGTHLCSAAAVEHLQSGLSGVVGSAALLPQRAGSGRSMELRWNGVPHCLRCQAQRYRTVTNNGGLCSVQRASQRQPHPRHSRSRTTSFVRRNRGEATRMCPIIWMCPRMLLRVDCRPPKGHLWRIFGAHLSERDRAPCARQSFRGRVERAEQLLRQYPK